MDPFKNVCHICLSEISRHAGSPTVLAICGKSFRHAPPEGRGGRSLVMTSANSGRPPLDPLPPSPLVSPLRPLFSTTVSCIWHLLLLLQPTFYKYTFTIVTLLYTIPPTPPSPVRIRNTLSLMVKLPALQYWGKTTVIFRFK